MAEFWQSTPDARQEMPRAERSAPEARRAKQSPIFEDPVFCDAISIRPGRQPGVLRPAIQQGIQKLLCQPLMLDILLPDTGMFPRLFAFRIFISQRASGNISECGHDMPVAGASDRYS